TAPRGDLRRAVRRRGGAAHAPDLGGRTPSRHGRADRRRRRRVVRRLRAIRGSRARRTALARPRPPGRRADAEGARAPGAPLRRDARSAPARGGCNTRERPLRAVDGGLPARAPPRAVGAGVRLGRAGSARAARAGDRRAPAPRRGDLPAGRPAPEGRPRLDGVLARAPLAASRLAGARARDLAPGPAQDPRSPRQGGAKARVRARPAPGDPAPPQDRLRRPARPLVPRRAARVRRGRAARPTCRGARPAAPRDRRAAVARARRGQRRSRAPALVSRHARALAANARRGGAAGTGRRCRRMSRRTALALVAAACVLPRLGILLYERGSILAAFTEKSDDFAQTFVASGTFGFIPGHPSAWTQPLYAFFLIPIYWIFGRTWWAVGGAQILVALGTALLVYAIGRRFVSERAGVLAAVVATLNPYLVWHDVHLNREILDQLLGAALVLLTLLCAERRSPRLAAALGLVLGLAILSNTRLIFLPIVVCAFLLWRARAWRPVVVALVVCALPLAAWAGRNAS